MANHFSTIGFPIQSSDDYLELAERVADDCQVMETELGSYLRWQGGSGAQLWLHFSPEREFIALVPHFVGRGLLSVGLTERIARPDDSPLEGAFQGWADPSDDDPESGAYPFVFDCPDAAACLSLELPLIARVRVSAFVHEIEVFPSVEAYDNDSAKDEENPRLASQAFIPSGLFSPKGEPTPPRAHAIFTGHVVESETRTNELTGKPFHWCLVDTVGGSFDVVIDPALCETCPPVGGVVSGAFWLSGQILAFE